MSVDDRTMLQFDWALVEDSQVTAILGRSAATMNDGTVSWASVALVIRDKAVTITVDVDTDELSVNLTPPPPETEAWQPITSLGDRIGKRLGWCWIGRNYRGYLDTFTLAFDGIDPGCMFVGVASAIYIKTVEDVRGA